MLAKMQSAQARIKIQEQLDGLSVDAEVQGARQRARAHQEHHRRSEPRQGAGRVVARLALGRPPQSVRRRSGQAATGGDEGRRRRRSRPSQKTM